MITVYDTVDVRTFRSRWLRIRYGQSFRGQPIRPVLHISGATSIQYALPAAALGLGRWIGRVPQDAERLRLTVELDDPSEFRLDEFEAITDWRLAYAIAAHKPRCLPGFLATVVRSDHRRTVQVQTTLDLAVPDKAAAFVESRRRAIEPTGLDARLVDTGHRPSIGFVLSIDRIDKGVDTTLRSLEWQDDPAFELHILADRNVSVEALARCVSERGLAARTRIAYSMPHSLRDRQSLLVAAQCACHWVALLRPGDRLLSEAVLVLREHAHRQSDLDVFYTDDVVSGHNGKHLALRLKPDWSPTFLSQIDHVGRLCPFRVANLVRIAGMVEADHPHPWWRALELAGASRPVGHLRRFLLIRPATEVEPEPRPLPLVAVKAVTTTILIPTRDRVDLLGNLVEGLLASENPAPFDIVVVDNSSSEPGTLEYLAKIRDWDNVTVINHPGPFNFAELMNRGAEVATGDVLVMLNNDCEIYEPNWLQSMTSLAVRPDIGAVGAKLLYPDGRLQHGGVAIGLGTEAGHRNYKASGDVAGHLDRLRFVHEVSAVTGACLAVEKRKFDEVGGLDPGFAVAFNDIDFCLRLSRQGYRNLFTPHAVLKHLESASRGLDKGDRRPRFLAEAKRFRELWPDSVLDDPHFHPVFSLVRFNDEVG